MPLSIDMEIKFEPHQNRLDVWIGGNLAIQGNELIGYEYKGSFEKLIEHSKVKIAVTKPDKGTMVFEFLGVDAMIILRTIETSVVSVTNAKMMVFHGDTQTLVY